ncbi:MAG: hypothetical protein HYU66_15860 [Armatimonadetes bacterium]|nr:hypothetical protein [Armatimonadota bacterium]
MRSLHALAILLAAGLATAQADGPAVDKDVVRTFWTDGAAKFQAGDVFGALTAWEAALRLDPDNEPIREKVKMVRADLTPMPVLDVVSGDTLRVRLAGRDATVHLLGALAKEPDALATSALRTLLRDQSVYLKSDPKIAEPPAGETVEAYVYRAPNGPFANLEMIRQGRLRADRERDYALKESFLKAEQVARGTGRGVWAPRATAMPGEAPAEEGVAADAPPPAPTPPEPQPLGRNLVLNAGLEEPLPEDALPRGWVFAPSPDGKYVTRSDTPGHQSNTCWTVEGRGEYGAVLAARVKAEAGRRYVGGGWAKTVGPGHAVIKLDYYQGTNLIGSQLAGVVRAGTDWQEFRIQPRTAPPEGATRVGLVLVLVGDGAASFDDVTLQAETLEDAAPRNLLANGTLESGVGSRPWAVTLYKYPNEQPWWRWSKDGAHTGERGLQIKGDTTYVILAHDAVAVDTAQGYELRGWVRSRSGEAVLKFDFLDGDFEWLGQETTRTAAPDGQWHELTLKADFKAYGKAKHVTVAAFAMEPGTDADFDDLGLYATGPR